MLRLYLVCLSGITLAFIIKSSRSKKDKENPVLLAFLYKHWLGTFLRSFLTSGWVNRVAGFYADCSLSTYHIPSFVAAHSIDMDEAEKSIDQYRSFNDFFIRTLKTGRRPLANSSVISPADGTVVVLDTIERSTSFVVKGTSFNLEKLLQNPFLAKQYEHGTLLLFRLAPWDYHRFHFPVDCIPQPTYPIAGLYESVNPMVYHEGIQPLTANERRLYILHTQQLSDVVMVSIGALCVGAIHETYSPGHTYSKGDEAGYFAFGGSSIVLLFKAGVITVEESIIHAGQANKEIPIKMGNSIAQKNVFLDCA